MNCRAARRLLERQLDSRATWTDELALEEHIAHCAACAERRARAWLLAEQLAALADPPVERFDLERALTCVHERSAERAAQSAARSRQGRRVLVAAALLIALGMGTFALLASQDDELPAGPVAQSAPAAPSTSEPGDGVAASSATAPTESSRAPSRATEPPPETAALRDDFDAERLDVARRATLEALANVDPGSVAALRGESAEDLARAVDHELLELRRSGWPSVRLVAGLIDAEDGTESVPDTVPDTRNSAVARGVALRYLGLRGDELALHTLVRALDDTRPVQRPADSADTPAATLAEIAARALLDCERRGYDGLGPVFAHAELARRLAPQLTPAEYPRAARLLAESAGAVRRGGDSTLAPVTLARLLSGFGPAGARELLEAGSRGVLAPEVALGALASMAEAEAVVAASFAASFPADVSPESGGPAFALQVCAAYRPDTALAWLVGPAYAQDPAGALDVLAEYRSPRALAAGMALWERGDDELVGDARIVRLVSSSAARAFELFGEEGAGVELVPPAGATQRKTKEANGVDPARLATFLVASGAPEASFALGDLIRRELLAGEALAQAVRALGELAPPAPGGERETLRVLGELFARLGPVDRSLAALVVVSVHRLGGDEAVRALFGRASDASAASGLRTSGRRSARSTRAKDDPPSGSADAPAADARTLRRVLELVAECQFNASPGASPGASVSLARLARLLEPGLELRGAEPTMTP